MGKQPFNFEKFVEAQAPVYEQALAELRAGRKRSHWMWFIFPQIQGLGSSTMAERYALHSSDEAHAYLEHPLLGPRLRECTEAVNNIAHRSAAEIFGWPDELKFRSSMTLFSVAGPNQPAFAEALHTFFGSAPDPQTLERLQPLTPE